MLKGNAMIGAIIKDDKFFGVWVKIGDEYFQHASGNLRDDYKHSLGFIYERGLFPMTTQSIEVLLKQIGEE